MDDGFVDISEEQDGGLLKKILVEGTGEETPRPQSDVSVHYVGTLHADGSKFDSSRDRPGTFDFEVGVGRVIRGWDVGICSMKKGEKAILRCASHYGYGEHGSPPKIPGGATLDFEVELFRWKLKPGAMTAEERSELAAKQKELGNAAVKEQRWQDAIDAYDAGIEYVTYRSGGSHGLGHGDEDEDEDEEGPSELSEEEKKLLVALLTNSAMCRMKVDDAEGAISDCCRALANDADNIKALFRRGQANLALGNYEDASDDAVAVLELEPDNKGAEQLKRSIAIESKKAKQNEKAIFSKMFGK